MSYVVTILDPEDGHPAALRVFGTFKWRETAEAFAQKINDHTEKKERGEMMYGWAYVIPVESPRVRQAQKWAMGVNMT